MKDMTELDLKRSYSGEVTSTVQVSFDIEIDKVLLYQCEENANEILEDFGSSMLAIQFEELLSTELETKWARMKNFKLKKVE